MANALLAAAVLLFAGGVLLWTVGRQRSRRTLVAQFLDARVDARRATAEEAAPVTADARRRTDARSGWLSRVLQRAGWAPNARTVTLLLLPTLALTALCGWLAPPPVAAGGGATAAALTALVVSLRIQRRRAELTRALPGFIDSLVRLLAVGHSVASAFLSAVGTVQGPLRPCLDGVAQRVRAGADLDKALEQAGRHYGVPPLLLFAAVMRMSIRYGGRVDQVLERMAQFLRDFEEAQQELLAMSAETRLSAWVLGLLPASMTLFILFINAPYLARMWNDAAGRQLLVVAFMLQLLGGYLLYRLARLR